MLFSWALKLLRMVTAATNLKDTCRTEKETQIYRTVFWTLWEKARVGCFRRTALKHVYYLG